VQHENKILIVDDNQFNINSLKVLLIHRFNLDKYVQIDEALNGEIALELVRKEGSRYSLIFMDC